MWKMTDYTITVSIAETVPKQPIILYFIGLSG